MNESVNELWVIGSFSFFPRLESALTGNIFWAGFIHCLCLCVCICETRGNFGPVRGWEVFKHGPGGSPPVLLGWLPPLLMHQTSLLLGRVGSRTVQRCWLKQVSLPLSKEEEKPAQVASGRETQEVSSALSGLASAVHSPPPVSAPPAGELSGILWPCFAFQERGLENIIDPQKLSIYSLLCVHWVARRCLQPHTSVSSSGSSLAVWPWAGVSTFLSLSHIVSNMGALRPTSCGWHNSYVISRRYLCSITAEKIVVSRWWVVHHCFGPLCLFSSL